MAVLYRTNAQSRAIEDALMREGIPYKIIGGVRFYERKEIKDALAYLKLIINPHDDVSLRRVINVPARGIGKGVMEALDDRLGPPRRLAAAARRRARGDRLGQRRSGRARHARRQTALAADARRRVAAAFRDLIAGAHGRGAHASRSRSRSARCSIRPATCSDLRDENSEEANERIENLMELVSAAREYETREPEPSLGGFVDRLSLLSEADEESGTANARVWLMTMHAAKGLEFPVVFIAGLEEGLFPHSRVERRRGGARRGAAALLRRHDARAVATGAHERGATARVRRVPGDRAVTIPRRDPARAHRARAGVSIVVSAAVCQLRIPDEPVRRGRAPKVREEAMRRSVTRTKISRRPAAWCPAHGCGTRSSASGTVISVEPLDDDAKMVVQVCDRPEDAQSEIRETTTGVNAEVRKVRRGAGKCGAVQRCGVHRCTENAAAPRHLRH